MDTRLTLIEMMRRVLAGGEITNSELSIAASDPMDLGQIERLAWQRLSQWADDDDIRMRNASYTEMRRRQVAEALAALEAFKPGYDPDEIAVGYHRATHIPLLVVLIAVVVLAALLYAMLAHGFFMHRD